MQANFYYVGGFRLALCRLAVLLHIQPVMARLLLMNLHATCLASLFASEELGLMKYVDILFGEEDEAVEFSKQS